MTEDRLQHTAPEPPALEAEPSLDDVSPDELAARFTSPEQLHHADRLAKIGRLAAGIIHELGTPLNVIKVRAQMIALGEVEGQEARESAEGISQQVDRMAAIIRQLLDFARHTQREHEPVDVGALATTTASLLSPLALKARCSVTVEPVGRGPFRVEGNAGHLQQLLVNLVTNAIHAMPDGGPVTLRVERISADAPVGVPPHDGAWVRVTVRDEGVGVADAIRDRIFEPFFTTKRAGMGTGLGLSVCAEIAKEHEGWIDLDSEVDVGSRFHLVLPALAA